MSVRLTDRLAEARRRRFVGRSEEQRRFQAALTADELPFQVLYVHGPGGVGKTTLLRRFAGMSEQEQLPTVYLDARNIEPTPNALVQSLQTALGVTETHLLETLSARPTWQVILIDTYELLAPLDNWLRDVFLPELPANVLIVLASRQPPAPAWRADPGWESFFCAVALRNLAPDESRAYLDARAIPAERQRAVLDFTHGHPLALSLVADVYAQRPVPSFQPESAPDVVRTLLEQFVQKVPGPAHRAALEACGMVRVMTETLLAQMLEPTDPSTAWGDWGSASAAHDLFEWLRGLSFIESSREGIFPHDLARETLAADLRWRNPDWYKELHRRARLYYTARIQQTRDLEQQRLLLDFVFLHRHNPVIRSMLEWQPGSGVVPDVMRPTDRAVLVAMVAQHEGAESAALAARWLERQPDGVTVYRGDDGAPAGFLAVVELQRASPEEIRADPATRLAWDYIQSHAAPRPGEVTAHYRFWMARDTYQTVSPVQTQILMSTVRYQMLTPGLAFHFLPCADPDFWAGAFSYANLVRVTETDFQVGDKRYGVYAHDWRTEPPMTWLALLAEREVAADPQAVTPPAPAAPIVVLSEPDFYAAVRSALHDYTVVEAQRNNPLLQSRLVVEKSRPGASPSERANTLRSLLKQAAESLQTSPREAPLYRALYHTYLQPAATQQQAAELLDLPFSTFRRRLKSAVDRVANILWHQEVGR